MAREQRLSPEEGSTVRRFRHDEGGQGLVEYALIIAVISVAAIAALGFLSDDINGLFSRSGNSLENATLAVGAGGSGDGGGTTTSPPVYISGASLSCSVEVAGVCRDTGSMTVDPGLWSGDPAPSLTFEWFYNQSAMASSSCTLAPGDGWQPRGSAATQDLVDAPSGTDSMGVRLAGSNTDPGSPASHVLCRQFEEPPAAPQNDQTVDSSMSLDGGGSSAATVVGSHGGRWYSQTITGNGSAPDITGGAVMRDSSGSNPTNGSACGFTLANGFSFTGKTWHQATSGSNDWDEPGSFFNDYEWACY